MQEPDAGTGQGQNRSSRKGTCMQTVDTTTALVDRYVAAWNATDATARAQLIAGA